MTGAAGFIGSFLSKRLLELGHRVIGLDNFNTYYDVNLKHDRIKQLNDYTTFTCVKQDITDKKALLELFGEYKPQVVIHLAAQAGVRYSQENPDAYIQSNINGFYQVLEACRCFPVKHLLYASSSSVYGCSHKAPFQETDNTDHPLSLYAATKKANEIMAYTYSHLYRIPVSGLRFFTVYGPMGRPDMAYFQFVDSFFRGEPVRIYHSANPQQELYRDFTYIDDIVEGIVKLIDSPPGGETPYQLYNIGNSRPEKLMAFIEALEKALSMSLGREVIFRKSFEPMKSSDVPTTHASVEQLAQAVGFRPDTPIEEGLLRFTDWYVDYYGLS